MKLINWVSPDRKMIPVPRQVLEVITSSSYPPYLSNRPLHILKTRKTTNNYVFELRRQKYFVPMTAVAAAKTLVASKKAAPSKIKDLLDLSKARLSLLVVISSSCGFLLCDQPLAIDSLVGVTMGTSLAAASAVCCLYVYITIHLSSCTFSFYSYFFLCLLGRYHSLSAY